MRKSACSARNGPVRRRVQVHTPTAPRLWRRHRLQGGRGYGGALPQTVAHPLGPNGQGLVHARTAGALPRPQPRPPAAALGQTGRCPFSVAFTRKKNRKYWDDTSTKISQLRVPLLSNSRVPIAVRIFDLNIFLELVRIEWNKTSTSFRYFVLLISTSFVKISLYLLLTSGTKIDDVS